MQVTGILIRIMVDRLVVVVLMLTITERRKFGCKIRIRTSIKRNRLQEM